VGKQLREKIDKWDSMKLKRFFLHSKRNGHRMEEAAHRMGEKSLPAYI
jgi:hypothetical protein